MAETGKQKSRQVPISDPSLRVGTIPQYNHDVSATQMQGGNGSNDEVTHVLIGPPNDTLQTETVKTKYLTAAPHPRPHEALN